MPLPRPSFVLILLLLASLCPSAAGAEPRLSRVWLQGSLTVADLVSSGLDVIWSRGNEVQFLERSRDAATLRRLGLAAEVLDAHPGRTIALRTRAELDARPAPPGRRVVSAIESDGVFRTYSHPPFGFGSMGGFWTTNEIKMKLDHLVSGDVNDIVANKLDTLGLSVKGRPVWGLQIGKAVQGTDTRPVVFMNALTHAREPQGMQTLFYFVDDLIARFGIDPFATYLLEKRRLYIVPLVNPDGYAQNESTYFGTGGFSFGFWRKNCRDNNLNGYTEEDSDGVDLNRNFPVAWGGPGADPNPWGELYHGPSPASEPETQIQRNLVNSLQPKTGISFHTFSELMLYPWGHTTTSPLDESSFHEWTDEMTRDNGYLGGQAPHVLYQVSGEFNDWCYGDTTSKPRMYSWTPEVGDDNDGFWPAPSRITPLARENLRACYVVMAIAGPWLQENGVTLAEGAMNAGHLTHVSVRARNLGLAATGPGLTGTLRALSTGARVYRATVAYPTIGSRQNGDPLQPFQIAIDDSVTPGRLLHFQVQWNAPDGFASLDTISVPCGTPTVLFSEDASGTMSKWSLTGPGTWGIVSNDPNHPSRYLADSPLGGYAAGAQATMRTALPLNLSTGVHAYAFFESRWEMESAWDGAYLEANTTTNTGTFTKLRATNTVPGSGLGEQIFNQPVIGGSRHKWKRDRVDLSSFTGAGKTTVYFRFRMLADGGNPYGHVHDGLNVDSVQIVLYEPAGQPLPVAVGDGAPSARLDLSPPAPNPARRLARFSFGLPRAGRVRLEILDVQGRRVRLLADADMAAGHYQHGWDLRDEGARPVAPGLYLARLGAGGAVVSRRLLVVP